MWFRDPRVTKTKEDGLVVKRIQRHSHCSPDSVVWCARTEVENLLKGQGNEQRVNRKRKVLAPTGTADRGFTASGIFLVCLCRKQMATGGNVCIRFLTFSTNQPNGLVEGVN